MFTLGGIYAYVCVFVCRMVCFCVVMCYVYLYVHMCMYTFFKSENQLSYPSLEK